MRRILGITDITEWIEKEHSRKVSEGMLRMWDRKAYQRRAKARERDRREETPERSRFLKSRRTQRGRYKKYIATLAYTEWGLVPHTGKGKRRQEYETALAELSRDHPKGRWDLTEDDWMSYWGSFPKELRHEYCLRRIDASKAFSLANCRIVPRK